MYKINNYDDVLIKLKGTNKIMFNKENNALIQLIKKERKLVLTGLIAGLSLFIFYYIFFYTTLYSTESKIYVKNIIKSDLVSNLDGGSTVVSESGYSNPLFNLYEILKSEKVAYKSYSVIKEKFPEDLNALGADSKETFFKSYKKLIEATTEPSTDIITIKFMWPNQKHAPIVLAEVLKAFQEENLFIRKAGIIQKKEMIDKQTEDIAKKLENVRNQIKNYKINAGISNIEVETINTVNARIDLEKQADILLSQIQYNRRKLNEFASELKIKNAEVALRATGIGSDPYLVKLSQDLAIAKQDYAKMRAKFKDQYPDVISVRNEISELQNLINDRKEETAANISIPRAVYDGPSSQVVTNFAFTQAEMVSLQAQWQALRSGINQLLAKEEKLPNAQMGLDELRKLEDTLLGAYKNIKEKQLEASIREKEIIDNIIILNFPSKASSLVILILTRFLGFMLSGLLLGLTAAYLKQALEDRWDNLDEMKLQTGQNVLGSIPWVKDVYDETSKNIMDAAYTNIASSLISKAYLNESFVVSFISTDKNQPRSTISETLTKKLSEMERSVLLIDLVSKDVKDFDLVEAVKAINKELRLGSTPGINESSPQQGTDNRQTPENIHNILKNAIKKQVLNYDSKKLKLDKIETNIKSENLNDILSSKGFKQILSILKNHYEFIFINAPHGFISLPEIQTLKTLSESIILISSMNTNRQGLMQFVEEVADSNVKILGIIAREENSELERHIKTLEQFRNTEQDKFLESIAEQETAGVR